MLMLWLVWLVVPVVVVAAVVFAAVVVAAVLAAALVVAAVVLSAAVVELRFLAAVVVVKEASITMPTLSTAAMKLIDGNSMFASGYGWNSDVRLSRWHA